MHVAKPSPPFVPAPQVGETVTAVWILIVLLVGIASFAIYSLANKVSG
jgi:hypothetical protein